MTFPNSTRTPSVAATDLAAILLVIAALGHAIEIGHHGAPFGAVGIAQLVGAFMLARRPTKPRRAVAIVGLLALGCLWALSRTVGLPLGPHAGHAGTLGLVDGLTVTAQLAAVVALIPYRRRAFAFAFATTLVVMTFGFAKAPSGNADAPGPTAEHSPADAGHHDSNAHTHP